jgi:16S rRNA (cytosine967-C5)-methyltransferase
MMPRSSDAVSAAAPDARAVALDLLAAVLTRRQALDEALAGHNGMAALTSRDRAFARQLVATTLRRLGQIDAMVASALSAPLPASARAVTDILRIGVAQLVFLGTPSHAAVSTAVDLTEAIGHRRMKGLVNAVLRRLAREGAGLAAAQDEARLNTRDWLWRSWARAYGDDTARAVAMAHLADPPLDLSLRDPGGAPEWAERLGGRVLESGTVRCPAGIGDVAGLPGYRDGAWWVQDAAAALPARLLGDIAGKRVIDLCAAPGGKTAQLAAGGGRVVAVDRSPTRLVRLRQNLSRLSLEAETVAADVADWRPALPASLVLLDAPCSATGTVRRHPDIPHLKEPADVARLARSQARLLTAAASMLAPGGTLVYCVCSLEPEEGPQRVEELLGQHPGFERRAVTAAEAGGFGMCLTPAGDLRTLPCHLVAEGGLDGFYAARLIRRR